MEFALLLPILLILLLAVVQVCVLARDRLLLAQASRAGARDKLYKYSPMPAARVSDRHEATSAHASRCLQMDRSMVPIAG